MIVSGVSVDLTKEEMKYIKERMGREPSAVEAGMLDIMWSEHCSYKASRPVLKMLPTSGKRVILGPGYDAGVVDIGDNQCIAFKIESHNHPSAIDPFSGAATGIGGIIRDVLAVGARPIALVDPIFFGRLNNPHTKWLMNNVVHGIGDYGNCTGIATVAGETHFDHSFEKNPLVNCACFGLVDRDKIVYAKAKEAGDLLVLVGSATGKDGIHGVTFASKNLHKKSEEERPAVQIPDPFLKKLIIEATLEALKTGKVKAIKDFGGGGLTCISSEIASKGGLGADIEVSQVHTREKLTAFEIMLSESQERMMFSCNPKDLKILEKIFEKYNVAHRVVGKLIPEKKLIVRENGKIVADVPIELLTDVPTVKMPSKKPREIEKLLRQKKPHIPSNLNEVLMKLLGSENIASKRWIYEQYDTEVGDRTVLKCGESDASVLKISDKKAIAIKSDCNYKHAYIDPYSGGAGGVLENIRNLTATGAVPIAIVDNLNFGNPNNPEVFYQLSESVRGMSDALNFFQLPCVGGNVSLYNEEDTSMKAIKPSPVSLAVGLIDNLENITSLEFKQEGDSIVMIGNTAMETGGSEYFSVIFGLEGGIPPAIDFEAEKNAAHVVHESIKRKLVNAAHDLSSGGLAVSLAEMCIKGNLGAEITLEAVPSKTKNVQADDLLFSESYGRYVLTTKDPQKILKLAEEKGVKAAIIGRVMSEKRLTVYDSSEKKQKIMDLAITSMRDEFENSIERKMR
ncbi:phosphoribosylformylglycinamidine synthase subunit PurL [Candidatus Micrarchaeota archaeon]|nr:phosphoribosylformylglycinamidine synthase subunit PurL [Candidatus Micrarchaeota archaeon]